MRHIPLSEFKDKMSETMAAVDGGEDVVITRHGRDYMRLVPVRSADQEARRQALAGLADLRRQLASRGIRATQDELVEWKNEGRR